MVSVEAGVSERLAPGRSSVAVSILAAASFAWFLCDAVATGWSRVTSDFPNYYTAARMTVAHAPLGSFFAYPTFQREMDRANDDLQLGGYIPQTPLAMLPIIPVSPLIPRHAKRAWLLTNLGFLTLALWLLSRVVRFTIPELWLIVFLGYGAIRPNFVLGQYYVLLLLLLAAAVYGLRRSWEGAAGCAFGLALVLKLYGAPFLPFLAAKRRFRAAIAFTAVLAAGTGFAIALFGWNDVSFYLFGILPRSLAGETLDPYHPANNSFVTLFRRLFVTEPTLNPHPFINSPVMFAACQGTFTSLVLLLPIFAAWRNPGVPQKVEIAWWAVSLLLLSPNTASYTFGLLVLPVSLFLDELPVQRWPYVLAPYIVLTLPLAPSWSVLFPKAWLLLCLYVGIASRFRSLLRGGALATAIFLAVIAGSTAASYAAIFPERPAPSAAEIAVRPGSIDSNSPAASRFGIFYESIAGERYVIRQWTGDRVNTWAATGGHAFHPSVSESTGRLYFALDSDKGSSIAFFDLATRRQCVLPIDLPELREPVVSPDGTDLAFLSRDQLYILHDASLRKIDVLPHPRDPSFAPDGRSLLYVSGLPNLSKVCRHDLVTGERTILIDGESQISHPALSPDNRFLLYAKLDRQTSQIWIADLAHGVRHRLTDGRCNSLSPVWSSKSKEVIFASDCNRGLYLPALFRLSVNLPE